MNSRQQADSIGVFRHEVRLALEARDGEGPDRRKLDARIQLDEIAVKIARYLLEKSEAPVENRDLVQRELSARLGGWITYHFDGAGGGSRMGVVGVLGYSSGSELRKKLKCLSDACQDALGHCKDLHDHLVFSQMHPAVMRLNSYAERLSKFESLHRHADAELQRDYEAIERVLKLVNSAFAQQPFPALKKQAADKNPALHLLGQQIYSFWITNIATGANDAPSVGKGSPYLLFATDVYTLLGYPAGERGMIKRLKEVSRRVEDYDRAEGIPNLFGVDDLRECAHVLAEDPEQLTEDEFNWLMSLPALMKMPRLARPPLPDRALLLRNERSRIWK